MSRSSSRGRSGPGSVFRGAVAAAAVALLAVRRLYLAIWHLANGLPDEGHLGQLAAFAGS